MKKKKYLSPELVIVLTSKENIETTVIPTSTGVSDDFNKTLED